MQQGDLPVGDALVRGQVVVGGAGSQRRRREPLLTLVDRPSAVVLAAQRVRRVLDVGGAGGDGGLHALDEQHPGIGRAGSTRARADRDLDAQSRALQGSDQFRKRLGG